MPDLLKEKIIFPSYSFYKLGSELQKLTFSSPEVKKLAQRLKQIHQEFQTAKISDSFHSAFSQINENLLLTSNRIKTLTQNLPPIDFEKIETAFELIRELKSREIDPRVIKDINLDEVIELEEKAEQLTCSLPDAIEKCITFPDDKITYDLLLEFLQGLKEEISEQKRRRNICKMAQDIIEKEETLKNVNQNDLYRAISHDSFLKFYKMHELIYSVLEIKGWNPKYPFQKDKNSSLFDFKLINFQKSSFAEPSMCLKVDNIDIDSIIEYETLKEWSKNSVYLCKKENENEHYKNNSAKVDNLILDSHFYTEEEKNNIVNFLFNQTKPDFLDRIRHLIRKKLDNDISNIDGIELDFKVPPLYFFNHNKTGYFKLVAVFKGLENQPENKNEAVYKFKDKIKYYLSHNKDAYLARIKKYKEQVNLVKSENKSSLDDKKQEIENKLSAGSLTIDLNREKIYKNSAIIEIKGGTKEYKLILELVRKPDVLIEIQEIYPKIYDCKYNNNDFAVFNTLVGTVRNKLQMKKDERPFISVKSSTHKIILEAS